MITDHGGGRVHVEGGRGAHIDGTTVGASHSADGLEVSGLIDKLLISIDTDNDRQWWLRNVSVKLRRTSKTSMQSAITFSGGSFEGSNHSHIWKGAAYFMVLLISNRVRIGPPIHVPFSIGKGPAAGSWVDGRPAYVGDLSITNAGWIGGGYAPGGAELVPAYKSVNSSSLSGIDISTISQLVVAPTSMFFDLDD